MASMVRLRVCIYVLSVSCKYPIYVTTQIKASVEHCCIHNTLSGKYVLYVLTRHIEKLVETTRALAMKKNKEKNGCGSAERETELRHARMCCA